MMRCQVTVIHGRRALEFKIAVIIIFSLILLMFLLLFSGLNIGWINALVDKIFGGL